MDWNTGPNVVFALDSFLMFFMENNSRKKSKENDGKRLVCPKLLEKSCFFFLGFYITFFNFLGFAKVIVEEAAEVLEPQILAVTRSHPTLILFFFLGVLGSSLRIYLFPYYAMLEMLKNRVFWGHLISSC